MKCNYVVFGAICISCNVLTRLIGLLVDPYFYLEDVPNRVRFVLDNLAYALMIASNCFVYLSVNTAATTSDESTKTCKHNWQRILIIVLSIVGAVISAIQDMMVLFIRVAGYKEPERNLYTHAIVIVTTTFIVCLVFMAIAARSLQVRLVRMVQTFKGDKGQAGPISQLERVIAVLKRFFYPSIALGGINLFVGFLYHACTGDLGPWSYLLTWALGTLSTDIAILLMLFCLEGNVVPRFPFKLCNAGQPVVTVNTET